MHADEVPSAPQEGDNENSRPASSPARKARRIRAWCRKNFISIETRTGRIYDLVMIGVIAVSVVTLALESDQTFSGDHAMLLMIIQDVTGVIFLADYLLRIWTTGRRWRYIRSGWGLIDLVAVLPLFLRGSDFAVVRALRILRVFSILKMGRYTEASQSLLRSLWLSRIKIGVFLSAVVVFVLLLGFTMHAVEPETFPTVGDALWWTVVTVTTVGYGDLVPATLAGKIIAGVAMVASFGIIAVPTGIVAAELGAARNAAPPPEPEPRRDSKDSERSCPRCRRDGQPAEANYCLICGQELKNRAAVNASNRET